MVEKVLKSSGPEHCRFHYVANGIICCELFLQTKGQRATLLSNELQLWNSAEALIQVHALIWATNDMRSWEEQNA